MKMKEIIVVEGRDDTAAIKRAIDCHTIETHGFGIHKETWKQLEFAYETKGLIIFTDPDHAGEEIRRKLKAAFPNAKHAWLTRDQALDGHGTEREKVGIEHAAPEHIQEALKKARCILEEKQRIFTQRDLEQYGLVGTCRAAERRRCLGQTLGIGYGNSKAFLRKLNSLGISKETFIAQANQLQE